MEHSAVEAFQWHCKSAEQADARAQYRLGEYLVELDMVGVKYDLEIVHTAGCWAIVDAGLAISLGHQASHYFSKRHTGDE